MPQTVPNRPTNGAVEPTVARKARPSCRRLWTSSMRALHAHRDPGVVVDVLGQRAFVVLAGLDAAVGDEAEGAALLQRLCAASLTLLDLKKRAWRTCLASRDSLQALVQLGHQDVPAAHAHEHQDDQRAARHPVALAPTMCAEAVGVVDRFLGHGGGGHRRGRRGVGRHGRGRVASGREAACAIAADGSTLREPKASDRTSAATSALGSMVFDMLLLSVCRFAEKSA